MDAPPADIPTIIPLLEHTPVIKSAITKKREFSFSQRYVRDYSVRPDIISLDHCYARNWNSQSDQSHAQSAKYISWSDNANHETQPLTRVIPLRIAECRMSKTRTSSKCEVNRTTSAVRLGGQMFDDNIISVPSVSSNGDEDDLLDVETVTVEESQFDSKATMLMTECERHMKMARPHASIAADEPINKTGWTAAQNKIFNRVYKVLVAARLSKLAHSGSVNEPVQRRNCADKSAKRIRQVFSNACWDEELLSWLHSVCMDNLHNTVLADYLEVLQTLRAKVPSLIENMISQSEHRERMSSISNEAMDLLLKRPWDPVTAMPSRGKVVSEKLPKNPLLLIVPQTPQLDSLIPVVKHRRSKLWNSQLSGMAKVIAVPAPNIGKLAGRWECFDAMVGSVRACIAEVKEMYPSKPIILLGWNFGALLATYVGAMEKISAVVALGYPLLGINGLRGDADDLVIDSITPTLFVVGEHAQTCPITDLENMRENMRAENDLLVVAGANDKLNINFKTKKERSLTQTIVDRCIQDEIRSYLERVLTLPSPQLVHGASLSTTLERLKKKKPQATINAFKGTNKIITTIKGMGSLMPSLPKKRKSPLKDGKSRKQMRYSKIMTAEQEQLAAISAISSTHNAADPLDLSSSSQGSLTALKPQSLSLPHLSSSFESAQTLFYGEPAIPLIKQEPMDTRIHSQHSRMHPAQAVRRKDLNIKSKTVMPTYIQLSGRQTGQSFAISMEKARELMNLGILRSFDRIKPVAEGGSGSTPFEGPRPVLSLTPTTPGSFTPATPSHRAPFVSSNSGMICNKSQHIRHLLSMDGRLVLPNTAKVSVKSATYSATSPVFADKGPLRPQSAPTLSPGQSLIKRHQASADQSAISSSISRQLQLTTTLPDTPASRTISVVLNTSKPAADKVDVVTPVTPVAVNESPKISELSVVPQLSIADRKTSDPLHTSGFCHRQIVNTCREVSQQQCVTVPAISTPVVSSKLSETQNVNPDTVENIIHSTQTSSSSKPLVTSAITKPKDAISSPIESTVLQKEVANTVLPQRSNEFTQVNLCADSNPGVTGKYETTKAVNVEPDPLSACTRLAHSVPKVYKSNTDCIDVSSMDVVSPGASSTLSAQSNTGFFNIETDMLPLVDDCPIVIETTDSIFNPETE